MRRTIVYRGCLCILLLPFFASILQPTLQHIFSVVKNIYLILIGQAATGFMKWKPFHDVILSIMQPSIAPNSLQEKVAYLFMITDLIAHKRIRDTPNISNQTNL